MNSEKTSISFYKLATTTIEDAQIFKTANNKEDHNSLFKETGYKVTGGHKQGWIFLTTEDVDTQVVQDSREIITDSDLLRLGQIEFRIGITPNTENLTKAFEAIKSLITKDKTVQSLKFVHAKALEDDKFENWHRGSVRNSV